MAKKTTTKNEFTESAHRVWLAGLGALAAAGEEGEKFFSSLVERGEKYEKKLGDPVEDASKRVKSTVKDVRSRAGKTVKGVQKAIDDQVTTALHRLGVPTRSEIAQLSERVEKLTAAVDSKRSKAAGKPRKKAATKKAAARKKTKAKKAPARKTSARKAAAKTTKKAASRRSA